MTFTNTLLQNLRMRLDMLCIFFIIINKDETTQNSYHLLIQPNHSRLNLTQACLKQLSVYLGTIDQSGQNGLN